MKKYTIVIVALMICQSLSAKKVKFAVNMSAELVNTTGIHIYGDFQEAAGFPLNWDPGATAMTQETSDTNVYSIVVDIPAFQVYSYRFINGIHTYETEFVPEESRINGAFDDNRWMYLDSSANDTTFIGVLPYSGNAPAGLNLVVFRVNMSLQTVSPNGVHVGGSWQGWDADASTMVTMDDTIYRYQAYVPAGNYEFKFVNGNTSAGYEYVGGACAVNGARQVIVSADIVLEAYNFASCIVGIPEKEFLAGVNLFPNPSTGNAIITFSDRDIKHAVDIADFSGRLVKSYSSVEGSLDLQNLEAGIYTVYIRNTAAQEGTVKLVIQ